MKSASAAASILVLYFIILGLVNWYTSLPIIDRSTATGACAEVDDPESRYTCQTVPDWPTLTRWVP